MGLQRVRCDLATKPPPRHRQRKKLWDNEWLKKKKGSDLVMVALQTKALTANPRNTGGCQMKKPGKMRTKEKGKKKKSTEGDWRTTRKEKQWFKY